MASVLSKAYWRIRLNRMSDVSPTLRLVAAATLPESSWRKHRRILKAISNSADQLADPSSLRDAQGAVNSARVQAELEGQSRLEREMRNVRGGGSRLYNPEVSSVRSRAKGQRDATFARQTLDILNGLLESIGRTPVS